MTKNGVASFYCKTFNWWSVCGGIAKTALVHVVPFAKLIENVATMTYAYGRCIQPTDATSAERMPCNSIHRRDADASCDALIHRSGKSQGNLHANLCMRGNRCPVHIPPTCSSQLQPRAVAPSSRREDSARKYRQIIVQSCIPECLHCQPPLNLFYGSRVQRLTQESIIDFY